MEPQPTLVVVAGVLPDPGLTALGTPFGMLISGILLGIVGIAIVRASGKAAKVIGYIAIAIGFFLIGNGGIPLLGF